MVFFPTPLIVLLWSTPKKQMYKPGHIWECLEENTAGESSHEKALHMGRAKSCSEAEGQMLQSDLNYRCASLLWTTLFILLGTTWWVWMFLLLWSTEIKRLPLLELTVLLLLSILLFQQGYSSPGDTNTILSLWMSRPGWLSTFFFRPESLSKWSVSFSYFVSQLIAQLSNGSQSHCLYGSWCCCGIWVVCTSWKWGRSLSNKYPA